MRLIVVGAGVAGLAAADAARAAGAEVVVLEARDRVGGRTWTAPLGDGWIDLGAAWVHDPSANPVAEALAAAGVPTRNDGIFHSRMAVWDGGWAGAPEATAVTAAVEADWDPSQALEALDGDDGFVEGVEWYLADRKLEGRTRDLVEFALLWIAGAGIVGGPPKRISLAGTAAYEEAGGGNLVVEGGYRRLVELLSQGLDLRLGAAATRIEHGGLGVTVRTESEAFEGDAAVVAVPLGVLKEGGLDFDPPLGDVQRASIERLEMGTLEKVAFRFEQRFWGDSFWQIVHAGADRAFPVWFDFTRHAGAPTLVTLVNPATSPPLAALAVEERAEAALDVLRKMFGAVPDPEQMLTTDWTGDRWARGSYSYIPLGASAADMSRLGQPVSDRLTLAGEATIPAHYGTVQAAFVSGLRAAAHVLGRPPKSLSLGEVPPHWLD